MSSVCILGAGELGGAVADALARSGRAHRVTIVDAARGIAAGKALDIQQSGAVKGFHTRLDGTDDTMRAAGAAVCVVADRAGDRSGEWQGDEGFAMLARLVPNVGSSPLVFAGASQATLMESLGREWHVDRRRLIGSAPEALASAVTAMVALEAGCSPTEVRLAVLGSADRGFVVPWGDASVGGYALERVLSQVQLSRLDAMTARLWPPGPFTLGLAAARVAEAILTSARRTFNVLTILAGEFGVRGAAGALPALMSTAGILQTRVPTLSTRERVKLETVLGVP